LKIVQTFVELHLKFDLSSERDTPTFRGGSSLGEDEVRGRRVSAHEAAERAIRERYLDERGRIASLPPPPPAPSSQSGVNSINILLADFTQADLKSAKRY